MGLVVTVILSSPVSASTSCSYSDVHLNTNPGAEAPSWAFGHRHITGNHYILYVSGTTWHWWADNNGGADGDTADTFFGVKTCTTSSPF